MFKTCSNNSKCLSKHISIEDENKQNINNNIFYSR